MNQLHERIIEISKKHNLSHVGSCLTSVDIIDDIYSRKLDNDPFILSCGHAGLALYCVLEKYYGKDAEKLYLKHGTHPNADIEDGIFCSTGSLGLGLTIALGMALADKLKDVYCLISDGEVTEGAIWEVMNLVRRIEVENLFVYCNWNGFGAYHETDYRKIEQLAKMGITVIETDVKDFGLDGISAHYVKL